MDRSIAEQFVILSLNPEKGRITIDNIHFRYSLTGSLLMDYLDRGDFTIENKRLVSSFSLNGEVIHDMVAEKIMNSTRNHRISTWIRRITFRKRFIFRELISSLEKQRLIRTENKKFLNIIPYRRFWYTDQSIRINMIESLRDVLLRGRRPEKRDIMLLGIIETAKAYKVLSRERNETRTMRKKNLELLKGDLMSAGINQAIREAQAAIAASVTSAIIAARSPH